MAASVKTTMVDPAYLRMNPVTSSSNATVGAIRAVRNLPKEEPVKVTIPSAEAPSEAQRDRDLVARHQAGDRSAFADFYHRYSTLVFNLALRQCGDLELAKDLSQESFLRLFKNLGKFEGRSSLKTWTYRVVLNHCRTRLSRRKPLQQLKVDEQGNELDLEDENRGTQARTEIAESKSRVGRALLEVEPSYREAVVLRDLEGLTYQEIADVLEVPVGTVRSRIARGRGQLRVVVLASERDWDKSPVGRKQ